MIEAAGGFNFIYDRLVEAIPSLPEPIVISTKTGEADVAYAAVLAAVSNA
jgi:hypothetical protein